MRILFLLLFNAFQVIFRKCRYGKRYQCSLVQRISPNSSLKLFDTAQVRIGRNIQIESMCDIQVHHDGLLEIGDRTYFNHFCMISVHEKVSIGKNCMFGPGVRIFDNNHRFSKEKGVSSDLTTEEIVIGDNCWIASNVIILKGVHIGSNCVIGAGCIVNQDIPSGSLVKNSSCLTIEELR